MTEHQGETIDVTRIMELIPHRYPFLLVDRLHSVELGKRIVGVKNVSINEPFFRGHFEQRPVMPGVLLVEAMAQTAACLVALTLGDEAKDKLVYFMTVDNARFRKPVIPGDQVEVVVELGHRRRNVWKFMGKAYVADTLVAEASCSAMTADK